MRSVIRTILAVVLGFALVASMISCASTPKTSTFLGDYSKNLQPGPKGGANERWLKPGVNFGQYKKIMLDHVVFILPTIQTTRALIRRSWPKWRKNVTWRW